MHIKIIALLPAPNQIIMIGPRAIFGSEFNTTKYGSLTRRKKSQYHNINATKKPTPVAIKKPISVSLSVIDECKNNSPLEYKSPIFFIICDGLEKKKELMISYLVSNSQPIIKISKIEICVIRISAFFVLYFLK